jgi:hypothetical protein
VCEYVSLRTNYICRYPVSNSVDDVSVGDWQSFLQDSVPYGSVSLRELIEAGRRGGGGVGEFFVGILMRVNV